MNESQYFCPRLIDYLTIVGAHPNSSKRSNLYELQNNRSNNEVPERTNTMVDSVEDNFYVQV